MNNNGEYAMRILVIASNTNFLDWIKKFPYEVDVFKFDTKISRIKKVFFWSILKPRLKLLSWTHDVVFCDWFEEHASIMSKISSKPIFIRLHRFEAHNPLHIKKAKYENIKGIITVSEYYKKIVNEIINGQVPIYVIPNSIDTAKFSFNMKTNYPLKICTLGNLTHRKRVFDLIVNNPDIEINIGGIGPEIKILKDSIKRFNSKATLHGFVRLPNFYHQHDIFILNSSDEGHCVALLEAMSSGLIPLSFAWNGVEETLPEEFIYQNYSELRKKINYLNSLPKNDIMNKKREVRSIIESKYTLKHQIEKFLSIFKI